VFTVAVTIPIAEILRATLRHNMSHRVVLYTRPGCHLCDEALSLLGRHGLSPEVVNIDADPLLREQYTDCVPVVKIDDKERFRGRVNEVLLRRLLASQGG
jgi:glutaredoxin